MYYHWPGHNWIEDDRERAEVNAIRAARRATRRRKLERAQRMGNARAYRMGSMLSAVETEEARARNQNWESVQKQARESLEA